MDRREHHRAKLTLPVRLRWTTPFGQRTEVSETLDVSRGGLQVACNEPHDPGVPLWVTFPYDNSLGDGQPEVPAKVVRAVNGRNGARHTLAKIERGARLTENIVSEGAVVGLHFERAVGPTGNGNGHAGDEERRRTVRRPLALPIRVRPEGVPWFEEAMTVDVSPSGLRFLSSREYVCGENLLISFERNVSAPWPAGSEIRSRVVRVDLSTQEPAVGTSICRID